MSSTIYDVAAELDPWAAQSPSSVFGLADGGLIVLEGDQFNYYSAEEVEYARRALSLLESREPGIHQPGDAAGGSRQRSADPARECTRRLADFVAWRPATAQPSKHKA